MKMKNIIQNARIIVQISAHDADGMLVLGKLVEIPVTDGILAKTARITHTATVCMKEYTLTKEKNIPMEEWET